MDNKREYIENECITGFWSGCNYWRNSGKNESEPINTATSMHSCDNCPDFDNCQMKKDTPVWEMSEND